MNKTNISLAIIFVVLSALTLRVRQQAEHARRWKSELATQLATPDPRPTVVKQDREITAAWNRLNTNLTTLQRTMPSIGISQSAELTVDSELDPKAASPDSFDVEPLLANPIDTDEVKLLKQHLDPKLHTLPARVQVYQEAAAGWLEVRAKWQFPINQQEFVAYTRIPEAEQRVLSLLDPKNPTHAAVAKDWLRRGKLPINDYLNWYRVPHTVNSRAGRFNSHWGLARMLECYDDAGGLNDSDSASQEFLKGIETRVRSLQQYEPLGNSTLALIGGVNNPRVWEPLERFAQTNRNPSTLVRLGAFSYWHKQRFGAGSELLADSLKNNRYMPRATSASSEFNNAPSDDEMELLNKPLNDAIHSLLVQVEFTATTADSRNAIYRRLVRLAPEDQLRGRVMQHLAHFHPDDESTRQWQTALWCRWADRSDTDTLFREAMVVNRPRASVDIPDATGEAIQTLSRLDCDCVSDLARFWLNQGRWSQSVATAWQMSGQTGEVAICEAIMSADLMDPPLGIQAALSVLASIGTESTLVTLDITEQLLQQQGSRQSALLRYISLAKRKTSSRLSAERSR